MKNILNDDGDTMTLIDPANNIVSRCEKLEGQSSTYARN